MQVPRCTATATSLSCTTSPPPRQGRCAPPAPTCVELARPPQGSCWAVCMYGAAANAGFAACCYDMRRSMRTGSPGTALKHHASRPAALRAGGGRSSASLRCAASTQTMTSLCTVPCGIPPTKKAGALADARVFCIGLVGPRDMYTHDAPY